MKTRNLLKTVCVILLVGVLAVSSLVGCSKPGEEEKDSAIKVENITTNGMTLSLFSETTVSNEEVYIEKGATAYVTPADAYDTSLIWSFKWENEGETEDINEYVLVNRTEQLSDGGENCYFRVYKPFANKNIILTV